MNKEQIIQLVRDAANFRPYRVIAMALDLSGVTFEEAVRLFDVPGEQDMRVATVKADILNHLENITFYGARPEFEKPAKELLAMMAIRKCSMASYGSTLEITAETPEEARRIEELLA